MEIKYTIIIFYTLSSALEKEEKSSLVPGPRVGKAQSIGYEKREKDMMKKKIYSRDISQPPIRQRKEQDDEQVCKSFVGERRRSPRSGAPSLAWLAGQP